MTCSKPTDAATWKNTFWRIIDYSDSTRLWKITHIRADTPQCGDGCHALSGGSRALIGRRPYTLPSVGCASYRRWPTATLNHALFGRKRRKAANKVEPCSGRIITTTTVITPCSGGHAAKLLPTTILSPKNPSGEDASAEQKIRSACSAP